MNKNFKELDKFYNNLMDISPSRYGLLSTIKNYFLNNYSLIDQQNLMCAEVGVFMGGFSKKINEYINPKHQFLIDIWCSYSDCSKMCNESNEYFNYVYENVCNNFSNKELYTIIRMSSKEASEKFSSNSLDFVYIDANHNDCYNDLTYWFDKIKNGGIIAGHDYYNKVKIDVDNFFNFNRNALHIYNSKVPQWYYIK